MKNLLSLLPLLLFAFASLACDEDSTTPMPVADPWTVVALPDSLPDGAILRVDARSGRALGTGYMPGLQSFLLEQSPDGWAPVDPGWPTNVLAFDFLVTETGRGVAVGGSQTGSLFVSVERPDWTATSVVSGPGILRRVIRRGDGSFLAVGGGTTAAIQVTGTLDGAWAFTSIPLPGNPNDKFLVSLVEADGVVYACGFDDGADGSPEEPDRFVMRDIGAGFEFMSAPCADCSRYEFTALAATESGGVLLGGAITNFSSNEPADWYIAFVAIYSPTQDEWTDVILPDASSLDRVNDILVASDGSIYLACGADGSAALVRLPPSGSPGVEWRGDGDAGVSGLSEAIDGSVLAAGWNTEGTKLRPMLLRRDRD